MSNLQDRFYTLLERYDGGIEPLENWTTKDLAELEDLVNAELQDRYHTDQAVAGFSEYQLGEFDDYED